MKKESYQRSREIINSPSINHQHSRIKPTPTPNRPVMSPARYFQGHPFSQVRAEAPYSHPFIFQSRGELQEMKEHSRYGVPHENEVELIPTEHIVALEERLKNVHDHYKKMISEEKAKNSDKSEVIMGLLEDMQAAHSKKVEEMRKMIEESEEQKKEVGEVDDKMNQIRGNIEDLIEQSSALKTKNSELEKKIAQKTKVNEQKQKQMEDIQQELLDARTELQQFELTNLRNNKINRQIMEIFNSASTIASDQ